LPLSPGRAERHGFEYYRHGTLSLYAALNLTHRVFGLIEDRFQVLYHFTMGAPVDAPRLQTRPPYQHLARRGPR
jgi:hypothetical protein